MTAGLPTTDTARARLRAAQRAETTALREVEAADRVRQRIQRALDEAEATLRAARLELVRVSGLDRAALLLDLPVDRLRSVTTSRRQRPASAPARVRAGTLLVTDGPQECGGRMVGLWRAQAF